MARQLGGPERAIAVACDVSDWHDQQRLVSAGVDTFGRLDVVVANAGIGAELGYLNSSPERWRELVLTNVYGAALTVRASMESLLDVDGHFVFLGSVAGRVGVAGSLYSATKWAITGMAEGVRRELQGSGVRVTVIEPGAVASSFFGDPAAGIQPFQRSEALEPADVARAMMFAISQPASVAVNEIVVRSTQQET